VQKVDISLEAKGCQIFGYVSIMRYHIQMFSFLTSEFTTVFISIDISLPLLGIYPTGGGIYPLAQGKHCNISLITISTVELYRS
jgi:hypothetical protein